MNIFRMVGQLLGVVSNEAAQESHSYPSSYAPPTPPPTRTPQMSIGAILAQRQQAQQAQLRQQQWQRQQNIAIQSSRDNMQRAIEHARQVRNNYRR